MRPLLSYTTHLAWFPSVPSWTLAWPLCSSSLKLFSRDCKNDSWHSCRTWIKNKILPAEFGANNSPLIAKLIVKFEHLLLLLVSPLILGMGGIDVGGVSKYINAYLSLHCLPFLPFTPYSSWRMRAMWLHLLSLVVSKTCLRRRSSS